MHNYDHFLQQVPALAITLNFAEHSQFSLITIFRTLDDLEEEINEEDIYKDDGTTDSEDESAPFGRKFLVFETSLLQLFQHCSTCLAPTAPQVQKVIGTMVVIEAKCSNGHRRIWQSQSCHGTLPWGNMLCAAGTLFTGSNPARVFSFFKHIGMSYISLRTYYYLQKLYLIPAVNCVWTSEQKSLLASFRGKHIDVGGDARCDSPGHCAKYGTYHIVELDSNKVLTVELVQVYNVIYMKYDVVGFFTVTIYQAALSKYRD